MRRNHLPWAFLALVALSSFFGLGSFHVFLDLPGVLVFIGEVWSASLAADVVFTAGTIGAGLVGYRTALRSRVGGWAVGALLHWLTYASSFLLLPQREGIPFDQAILFVVRWGWLGLLLAASAPVVVAHLDARAPTAVTPAPPGATDAEP